MRQCSFPVCMPEVSRPCFCPEGIGYEAVDMGPLAQSWRSEPTTSVYVAPYLAIRPRTCLFLTASGARVSKAHAKSRLSALSGTSRFSFVSLSAAGVSCSRDEPIELVRE